MTPARFGRRRFLARSVLTGLGAAAVVSPAAAFKIEESIPAREALLRRACEARAAHDEIVKELIAEIAAVAPDQAAEMVKAMNCPLCGCSLAYLVPDETPRF